MGNDSDQTKNAAQSKLSAVVVLLKPETAENYKFLSLCEWEKKPGLKKLLDQLQTMQ